MSVTTISGDFSVFGAEISQTGKVMYVTYKTSVHTEDRGESYPAYIRTFLPQGTSPLADHTTICLHGKIWIQGKNPFVIETIEIAPYPGNPADAHHGIGLPAVYPRIDLLGHVQTTADTTYDGRQIFKVISTAFVRGKTQSSTVLYVFSFITIILLIKTPFI